MIAAQQYFIEYGNQVEPQRLQTLLASYIPDSYLQKSNSQHMWMNVIINKLQSPYFQNSTMEPSKVEIILFIFCIIFLSCILNKWWKTLKSNAAQVKNMLNTDFAHIKTDFAVIKADFIAMEADAEWMNEC